MPRLTEQEIRRKARDAGYKSATEGGRLRWNATDAAAANAEYARLKQINKG